MNACQCGDFRLATCGNCALAEGVSKGEEARTVEIVEWLHEYVLGICDEQTKEDIELCRDRLIEKFLLKVKPMSKCEVGCSPQCTTCGRTKKPVGRDSMDNGRCDYECPGYREAPSPCDLWPGEWREGESAAGYLESQEEALRFDEVKLAAIVEAQADALIRIAVERVEWWATEWGNAGLAWLDTEYAAAATALGVL